jgi:hypothetical protein
MDHIILGKQGFAGIASNQSARNATVNLARIDIKEWNRRKNLPGPLRVFGLKKCHSDTCEPIEQVRGKMGPGDYFDVIHANPIGHPGAIPNPETYGDRVERAPDGEKDFRICCKTCGLATPWNKANIPGMPGAGEDYTRKLWNAKFP